MIDADELQRLYVDEGLSSSDIAPLVGKSPRTVARWLNDIGVEIRGAPKFAELQDPKWVKTHYVDKRMSSLKIAKLLGCSPHVVTDALKRHGIKARPRCQNKGKKFGPEFKAKISKHMKGRFPGSKNPNWKGGYVDPTARERRGGKALKWRNAVKERDGYKCRECGATDRLHAHHVKSWNDYPDLRFDVDNGLTLCVRCHQKAHGFPFPAWLYGQGKKATSATPSNEVKT